MPAIATEYGCPTCRTAGKKSRIFATDGALTCQEDSQHRWVDIKTFQDLQPSREFTVTPPKFVDTTPKSEMHLNVPTHVKVALETKFAGRLEATVVGFLTMMTEGEVLPIPQSDLKLIAEKLGANPKSSGELKGMVYSLAMDKETAEQNDKISRGKLEAFMAKNPGMVVVNLHGIEGAAEEQAKNRDMTLDQFCEWALRTGVESNWF